jgi:hypothetical protein
VPALDDPHEITDSMDAIGYDIRQLETRNLILNRHYQFEAIEPVRPEVITKARLVCDALTFHAKIFGYNAADLESDTALQLLAPVFTVRERIGAQGCQDRIRKATNKAYVC